MPSLYDKKSNDARGNWTISGLGRPAAQRTRPSTGRFLTALAISMTAVLACAACGTSDSQDAPSTTPAASGAVSPNTDEAGRASRIPSARRIDVGVGDDDLEPLVMAAEESVKSDYPDQTVQLDTSFYGSNAWGQCLGSSEVTATRDRAGWGTIIEQCEKSGIRIITLPIASGVWLLVNNRASMRPEVVDYMHATFDHAQEAAAGIGITPLNLGAIAASRARYDAFVAKERAAGSEPMIG